MEDAQQKKTTPVLGRTGTEVLDGRNAHLPDGVQRALGPEAKDFGDYARDTGVWNGARS
jgi:hypothetical protein